MASLATLVVSCHWVATALRHEISPVREFRNYTHPQQQVAENFRPRKVTAQVAKQVLRAAIDDLGTHTSQTDR